MILLLRNPIHAPIRSRRSSPRAQPRRNRPSSTVQPRSWASSCHASTSKKARQRWPPRSRRAERGGVDIRRREGWRVERSVRRRAGLLSLIRPDSIHTGGVKPFAEVKPDLRELAAHQKALDGLMPKAKAFSTAAAGSTLEAAAKAQGLSVVKVGPFARSSQVPELGMLSEAVGAAFSPVAADRYGERADQDGIGSVRDPRGQADRIGFGEVGSAAAFAAGSADESIERTEDSDVSGCGQEVGED